jgi:hypothetical protein
MNVTGRAKIAYQLIPIVLTGTVKKTYVVMKDAKMVVTRMDLAFVHANVVMGVVSMEPVAINIVNSVVTRTVHASHL